jgi:hypothetical protein
MVETVHREVAVEAEASAAEASAAEEDSKAAHRKNDTTL